VFCFPVLPDFFQTHQWLHELRRRSRVKLCGVYFRIPDEELVHCGHFGSAHNRVTAVQAVATAKGATLGTEVIVPRTVSRGEILRVKTLPQIVGWRHYPEAKGSELLWPQAGTYGARRLRDRITETDRREEERYFGRFPPEWYTSEDET